MIFDTFNPDLPSRTVAIVIEHKLLGVEEGTVILTVLHARLALSSHVGLQVKAGSCQRSMRPEAAVRGTSMMTDRNRKEFQSK